MLSRVLRAHPSIASGPESYIIETIEDILAAAERRAGRQQGLLAYRRRDELLQSCARWFLDVFRDHVGSKPIFLEKTPSNLARVTLIHELFPRARIIHLYRDGRDVVYSLLHARHERHYDFPATLEGCTRAWRKIEHVLDFGAQHPELCVEVRYEELLADPERSLTQLCGSLGLPLARPTLGAMLHALERKIHPSSATGADGFVGKWRGFFSASDVAQFKSIGGDLLIRLRYETDSSW